MSPSLTEVSLATSISGASGRVRTVSAIGRFSVSVESRPQDRDLFVETHISALITDNDHLVFGAHFGIELDSLDLFRIRQFPMENLLLKGTVLTVYRDDQGIEFQKTIVVLINPDIQHMGVVFGRSELAGEENEPSREQKKYGSHVSASMIHEILSRGHGLIVSVFFADLESGVRTK